MTKRKEISNDGWVDQNRRTGHSSQWRSCVDGVVIGTAVNERK